MFDTTLITVQLFLPSCTSIIINQAALAAIPLFLAVTLNLFNHLHLVSQLKKYLGQSINNSSLNLSSSQLLKLLESISIFLSLSGAVATIFINQAALAAIPLSLAVTLNLFNHRHLLSQLKKYLRHLGY